MGRRRLRNEEDSKVDGKGPACWNVGAQSLTVRDMPSRLRPREAIARCGVRGVSDDVLLAVVLRSGVRGMNVVNLSRSLLQEYGSLGALASSTAEELASRPGVGNVKAQVLMAALELGRRLTLESRPTNCAIKTPEDVARVLAPETRGVDHEIFWVLRLDSKNRLKGEARQVSSGLLDASLVHPREVFREAIRSASAAIVLAHNHPSGDCSPSSEDIRITKQLVEAGRIIDIRVLDHIILGQRANDGTGCDFLSLRERGLVQFA